MGKIHGAKKLTDKKFLNLYELDAETSRGQHIPYLVASRAKDTGSLRAVSQKNTADAVAVYATCNGKLLLLKQYRYAVGDYVYELPAGLVDEGESIYEAAVREVFEETGLQLSYREASFSRPFYSSAGMTDETCAVVFGEVSGEINGDHREETEEIEVLLVSPQEAYRILTKEKVCMKTALILMDYCTGFSAYQI